MEFRLLGPFEAIHRGVPVDLGDLQQRYVLVVLLLHANKPVSSGRLIDIVWGTNRPKTNLVPGYIAKIRKAFREVGADDVGIVNTPTGYVLRVDDEQLDTTRFGTLVERARRDADPERAAALLREALTLWRGDFLEDLDIDRIGGVDVTWLDENLLDAIGDLADLELAAGNHREVRDRLRPAVQADPSRQRLAILLMRALLSNGDRVEAIKVYHRTGEALEEYGMKASKELRDLARLAHGIPLNTLPPRLIRFTGRAAEISSIESLVRAAADAGVPGVVWLSGMPGVGKTALAAEAAHRLRGRFGDASLFITLNGFTPGVEPTTSAEALGQLLLDLGVPAERIATSLRDRNALYQNALTGTETLVVLDNALSEDQVRPLLPETSGCLAIVTSRKSGDLENAGHIRLDPLPAEDAADLFGNLVGPDRVRGYSAQVNEVVARCGQLPLQIKVVASQFRQHRSWRLDHLIHLLNEVGPWGSDSRLDNEGIVACTVSYQQLDDQRQRMFRLVGLNPGQDLSVHGAAALAQCDAERARMLLDDLHGVSLLEEAVPDRYHMLDPLKVFATSVPRPATPHESREAIDRLLDFYLVATSSAIDTAFPFDGDHRPVIQRRCAVLPAFRDRQAALDWLATERANLVAAIRYAAGHQRPEHTWQLAVSLWRYFYTTGHVQDWTETLELARQATMADPENRYGQAHVLLRLSGAHWRSGNLPSALELAAQALPRWERLGDIRGEADALCAIAVATMDRGDHGQAVAHFEAALTKYQKIDDWRGQANALSLLGHLNELHGELDLAEHRHVAAVDALRAISHTQGLAHALDNLGCTRQRLGRFDQAMANHEEARALAVEIGDRSVEAYALNNIGNVMRLTGDLDAARRSHEQAWAVASAIADPHLRTQLQLDRGATCQARGDHRAASRIYRVALDLAAATGDRAQWAHANRGIAKALHDIGEHGPAAEHWGAAETEFAELNLPEAGEIRRERALLPCGCASVSP